jgi:hypothetical protein
MSTSFQISREHNLQTILWSIGGAVIGAGRLMAATVGYGRQAIGGLLWALIFCGRCLVDVLVVLPALCRFLWACVGLLWAIGCKYAPTVCKWALRAAPWLLGAAALFGALLIVFAYPVVVGCALGIAAYAYVSYPRKAARP